MGTKRFYRVFCDVCETVHIHTRSSITTASAARAAAKEDGWQTRGEGNSITYDAEQASESYHRRRVA